jgi:hypothetical protein
MFPADDRAAQCALGRIVVERNARILDKPEHFGSPVSLNLLAARDVAVPHFASGRLTIPPVVQYERPEGPPSHARARYDTGTSRPTRTNDRAAGNRSSMPHSIVSSMEMSSAILRSFAMFRSDCKASRDR